MWLVYILLIAAAAVLLILSAKEKIRADPDTETMNRMFLKSAAFLDRILRKAFGKGGRKKAGESAHIHEDMKLLYPSGAEHRAYRYRVEKLSGLLFFCFVGAAVSLLILLSGRMEGRLTEDGRILRNPYGGGEVWVELKADTGTEEKDIQLQVEERQFTREELEEMIAKITAALEEEIKGENESLDEIRTSLVLPDSVDGYPFSIAWLSGDYERIQADGSVNNAEIEQKGELVELTATLTYLDQTWEEEFMVRVCPPILTPEEESRRQLEKEAQENEKEAVHEESFPLPELLGQQKIVWKEKAEDNSPWFFAIILLAGAVQYRFSDEALKKKLVRREEELLRSYPEFVSKLVLLMGAGLPVRAAFMRMAADYQKKQKKARSYVYEELLLACHEMESGVTELQAYEHFGQRCRLPQYRKCMALLSQNLKRGASGLLPALLEESERSFEERKRSAREEGEKAGTKLLLPMMMMLVVVMILIMVPACFSFAGM